MKLVHDLLETIGDGAIIKVRVGSRWTGVLVETAGGDRRLGLASTLPGRPDTRRPAVPGAGRLDEIPPSEMAALALSDSPPQVSIGFAALNALLPSHPELWTEENAEEAIARNGEGKRVVLVGSFPFGDRLRERVGELSVLEKRPIEGTLPEEAAAEVLPHADLIALTGMTLLNGTFESLLRLRPPGSMVVLLGPSTPLSPLLFDRGIDIVSGAVVTGIEPVMRALGQGAGFRQLHAEGVRLVTMMRGAGRDHSSKKKMG